MFKSKTIRDPSWPHPNRMGRTVGYVFHPPRFWDCQKYDFYTTQFDQLDRQLSAEELELRYQAKRAHEGCKRKHLSYVGYTYWQGPKRRYYFYFMGNPRYNTPRWKIFDIQARGTYTRWFDDGEQNRPRQELTAEDQEILRTIWDEFATAREQAAMQMHEYERIRSADGRGKYKP